MSAGPFDLSKFFTYSLDMLCIAGFDGYFKQINPAFERTLGWSTEELLEKPFVDFVHPEDAPATVLEVEKLSHGVPTVSFENRYRCRNGNYRHFLWTSFPDTGARLLYAVARDVTERKVIEQARETKLKTALDDLHRLRDLIPICSYCKNIRNDEGYWRRLEMYLEEHTELRLTHSICPSCSEKHYGDYLAKRDLV